MHWRPRSFALIALLRLSLADMLRIDDSDSTVRYQGAWTFGTEDLDDWERTLHYANVSGTTATLTFTGAAVDVYGSFHPPGTYVMKSQYSIDGRPAYLFIPPPKVSASTHQALFYSSPALPHGEHTLVVTNLGQQFFLDFFVVEGVSEPSSSSTTPVASTAPSIVLPTQTLTSSLIGDSQTSFSIPPTNTPSFIATTTDYAPSIAISWVEISPTPLTLSPSSVKTVVESTVVSVTNWTSVLVTTTNTPPSPPSRREPLTRGVVVGVVIAGGSLLALAGITLWSCRKRIRGADSKSSNLSVLPQSGTLMIDSDDAEMAELATIAPDPRLRLAIAPKNVSLPNLHQANDDTPRAGTGAPHTSPRPFSDASHILYSGLSGSDVAYGSFPRPGTTTTKSEALPKRSLELPPLPLPSPSAQTLDNIRIAPVPATYGHAISRTGDRSRPLGRIRADSGVRLAGGPPGEAPEGEEYSDGWDDLPPPYQAFGGAAECPM